MTPDQDLYDQIEAYLEGRLNEEAVAAFERQLQSDPELVQEVADLRTARFLLKSASYDVLKTQLKSYSKELEQVDTTPIVSISHFVWKWAIAASLVLGLTVTWFWMKQNTVDTADLVAAYYVPYPNIINPVKMGEKSHSHQEVEKEAMRAYEAGDFMRAAELLEQLSMKSANQWWLFYLGNAYLGAKKGELASRAFLSLKKQPTFLNMGLSEQTDWYLALSYLQMDRKSEAKALLRPIQTSSKIYGPKAKELLDQLE